MRHKPHKNKTRKSCLENLYVISVALAKGQTEYSGNSSRGSLARFGHLGLDHRAHQTVQSVPSDNPTNMRAEAGPGRQRAQYEVSAPFFRSGIETGQGTALPAPTFKNTTGSDYVSHTVSQRTAEFSKQDNAVIRPSLRAGYANCAERLQLSHKRVAQEVSRLYREEPFYSSAVRRDRTARNKSGKATQSKLKLSAVH